MPDVYHIQRLKNEADAKRQHFHMRTCKHIQRVQNNIIALFEPGSLTEYDLTSIVDGYELDQKTLLDELRNHDSSKFEDPQHEAYVEISWSYYQRLDLGVKDYPLNQVFQSAATIHHILTEKHHPEYWDRSFITTPGKFNTANRDGLPDVATDATAMPLEWVAVMACDWLAVAQERGNNPWDWIRMTVNKRWLFTEDQIGLIYQIATVLYGSQESA